MFNIKRIVDSPMLTHRVSFLTLCVSCTGVFHRRHATDKGGPIVPRLKSPMDKRAVEIPSIALHVCLGFPPKPFPCKTADVFSTSFPSNKTLAWIPCGWQGASNVLGTKLRFEVL